MGTEFDAATTSVVYEQDGVTITAFPVIHNLHGAVGYRVDFAGVSMVFSGDTHPCWPLVHAAQGTDLLIHECFPSAATLAAVTGRPIERFQTITATHTVPKTAGKVFSLVQPRMGALWHTFLVPAVVVPILEEVSAVFDGPVVQTQDLTIFNITKEAVVARQVQARAPGHRHPRRGEDRTDLRHPPRTTGVVGRRDHPGRRRTHCGLPPLTGGQSRTCRDHADECERRFLLGGVSHRLRRRAKPCPSPARTCDHRAPSGHLPDAAPGCAATPTVSCQPTNTTLTSANHE